VGKTLIFHFQDASTMRIQIHTAGLELLNRHRLWFQAEFAVALQRFGAAITRVDIFLADENAGKGGIDKSCRVVVSVRRQPRVIIEDRDSELYAMMVRVQERAVQVLQRAIARKRSRLGATSMSGI
jgi:putative sigma-54 modulation protein